MPVPTEHRNMQQQVDCNQQQLNCIHKQRSSNTTCKEAEYCATPVPTSLNGRKCTWIMHRNYNDVLLIPECASVNCSIWHCGCTGSCQNTDYENMQSCLTDWRIAYSNIYTHIYVYDKYCHKCVKSPRMFMTDYTGLKHGWTLEMSCWWSVANFDERVIIKQVAI